ncbi:MAG: transposase, partial [Halioglobus sp.]
KLRLTELLEVNEALLIMHTMKEQLRLLWIKGNRKNGQKFLGAWICDAIDAANNYQAKTGIDSLKPLKTLAFTLAGHMSDLLNYFDYPITNGKAEGINNKIKTLKRQAYGYRYIAYFKLRLYHLHTSRYRLCG